ncbi:MAG: hypothetical protein N3D18_06215 [Roseococcus sp.]|nr:hypothetical protein [Roseococcus sp.]
MGVDALGRGDGRARGVAQLREVAAAIALQVDEHHRAAMGARHLHRQRPRQPLPPVLAAAEELHQRRAVMRGLVEKLGGEARHRRRRAGPWPRRNAPEAGQPEGLRGLLRMQPDATAAVQQRPRPARGQQPRAEAEPGPERPGMLRARAQNGGQGEADLRGGGGGGLLGGGEPGEQRLAPALLLAQRALLGHEGGEPRLHRTALAQQLRLLPGQPLELEPRGDGALGEGVQGGVARLALGLDGAAQRGAQRGAGGGDALVHLGQHGRAGLVEGAHPLALLQQALQRGARLLAGGGVAALDRGEHAARQAGQRGLGRGEPPRRPLARRHRLGVALGQRLAPLGQGGDLAREVGRGEARQGRLAPRLQRGKLGAPAGEIPLFPQAGAGVEPGARHGLDEREGLGGLGRGEGEADQRPLRQDLRAQPRGKARRGESRRGARDQRRLGDLEAGQQRGLARCRLAGGTGKAQQQLGPVQRRLGEGSDSGGDRRQEQAGEQHPAVSREARPDAAQAMPPPGRLRGRLRQGSRQARDGQELTPDAARAGRAPPV